MAKQLIDQFVTCLPADKRVAVYESTKSTHEKRTQMLLEQFADPNRLRQLAGEITQHVIENLDTYLPQVEAKMQAKGVQVHWATTGEEACMAVLRIMQARQATKMVKAKTMVSEEIGLAPFLESHGIECLETDLGELPSLVTSTKRPLSTETKLAPVRPTSAARYFWRRN